ncbi:PAS domain S-box protein [Flavobacterium hiemivividum]|uniref:PAS domain S-box protein n=1 Tax=Flavobacterium hiemivividum TaxID=2541734 RepID=A0A4R5CVB3_9FLAO|nr:PAS domain S-box protein [Flavobacterium hiemivividum]TDE03607.1 PAS domain S-box protein [Flavobacterium hiemivividum]
MEKLEFKFSDDNFNRLFPFYILIDDSLTIKSYGKSLAKICPGIEKASSFAICFEISRPYLEKPTFQELVFSNNQLTVITCKKSGISLRGQFELIESSLLFVGSPWFQSMKEVVEKKLTLHDFALHDPLLDLLHVLNNQENTSKELKELLTTINNQKNKLKLANKEIHDIALFPMQNPDPLIRLDFDGNLLKRNPAAEKLSFFIHLEKEYNAESFFKYIIKEINVDAERYTFETKCGTVDYSFVCKSLKEERYINIYGRDITEQKKNQAELERLSLVASSNENGIVFTNPDGSIFWCNDAYTNLTGYSKEFILGKTPIEIGNCEHTHKEDFSKMLLPFYRGEHFEEELIHGRKDGSYFWSRIKGQPIFDEQGNVKQYFAMLEDISLKKRYDESLEIEKSKYQNIIANMNLGLLEVDLNDVITLSNNSFSEMSGYASEELKGKKASEFLIPEERLQTIQSKNHTRTKGEADSYEVKIVNKKGEKRNWLISGAPNYDLYGNIIGSIGIHLDITEQKRQEEQLFLLSLIAEKNINAVIITDKEGTIEWANPSFLYMSGFSMEEIIGRKPGHFLQGSETNPETICYMKDCIQKGLPFNCEIINYSKNGEKYWVNIQGQALYNKNNEVVKFFAIEENITKKKELEQQREFLVDSLAKSNEELEDYASIVSHDLKSPLRSIYSLLTWIKEDNQKEFNPQTLQYLGMMENKVEKMDHLIEGILTYAKIDKTDVAMENVNTQEIVQNIINIIHIPSHTTVVIKNNLPMVKADRFRIQQLFQNIISNAVNYIDKPSGIVEVDCKSLPKHYLFSIKDNGPGIAKENQEKIFKIFQSLGSSDKSTGLGLSIVKKIIDLYHGKIWIESEIGQGATFFIKLNK